MTTPAPLRGPANMWTPLVTVGVRGGCVWACCPQGAQACRTCAAALAAPHGWPAAVAAGDRVWNVGGHAMQCEGEAMSAPLCDEAGCGALACIAWPRGACLVGGGTSPPPSRKWSMVVRADTPSGALGVVHPWLVVFDGAGDVRHAVAHAPQPRHVHKSTSAQAAPSSGDGVLCRTAAAARAALCDMAARRVPHMCEADRQSIPLPATVWASSAVCGVPRAGCRLPSTPATSLLCVAHAMRKTPGWTVGYGVHMRLGPLGTHAQHKRVEVVPGAGIPVHGRTRDVIAPGTGAVRRRTRAKHTVPAVTAVVCMGAATPAALRCVGPRWSAPHTTWLAPALWVHLILASGVPHANVVAWDGDAPPPPTPPCTRTLVVHATALSRATKTHVAEVLSRCGVMHVVDDVGAARGAMGLAGLLPLLSAGGRWTLRHAVLVDVCREGQVHRAVGRVRVRHTPASLTALCDGPPDPAHRAVTHMCTPTFGAAAWRRAGRWVSPDGLRQGTPPPWATRLPTAAPAALPPGVHVTAVHACRTLYIPECVRTPRRLAETVLESRGAPLSPAGGGTPHNVCAVCGQDGTDPAGFLCGHGVCVMCAVRTAQHAPDLQNVMQRNSSVVCQRPGAHGPPGGFRCPVCRTWDALPAGVERAMQRRQNPAAQAVEAWAAAAPGHTLIIGDVGAKRASTSTIVPFPRHASTVIPHIVQSRRVASVCIACRLLPHEWFAVQCAVPDDAVVACVEWVD